MSEMTYQSREEQDRNVLYARIRELELEVERLRAEFQKAEAGWVEPTKVLLAEVERLREKPKDISDTLSVGRGRRMPEPSEAQETLERYIRDGAIITPPHVTEAIRAVLDLVRVQYEANEEMTRLLTDAQADVSQAEGVARGYMLAAERAEAERDALLEEVALQHGLLAESEAMLVEEHDARMQACQDYEDENARFKSRGGMIDRLEAERDALRAALRGLLSYVGQLELLAYQIEEVDVPHATVANARAALAPEEKP